MVNQFFCFSPVLIFFLPFVQGARRAIRRQISVSCWITTISETFLFASNQVILNSFREELSHQTERFLERKSQKGRRMMRKLRTFVTNEISWIQSKAKESIFFMNRYLTKVVLLENMSQDN
ncbi:hypothetical protein ACH5RR_041863 [Cinchona calisaya]|uniref:Uncharacterized protein n=1 Tax=Cinchona calisaya TaxID=153742 RepID=A0ABD2XUP9_9GENT